ncbi:MAG: DUF6888 family protein, partial [Dolichospermum sp.]
MFNPTAVQALTCLRVCQMVSNSFLDIHLIRFNEIKGYISRLALKIVVMTREQGTGNREQVLGNFTFRYLCRFFSAHLLSTYRCYEVQNHPTPNPLPASKEGAMMYFTTK